MAPKFAKVEMTFREGISRGGPRHCRESSIIADNKQVAAVPWHPPGSEVGIIGQVGIMDGKAAVGRSVSAGLLEVRMGDSRSSRLQMDTDSEATFLKV